MNDVENFPILEESEARVQLEILDLDTVCKEDLMLGYGFYITEKSLDKRQKTENGILSSKFATDWEDDFSFAERYSCKCKELRGKYYNGQICPECGTEVKFVDVDMRITGWIKLNRDFFIHPTIYKKLEYLIGDAVLKDILTPKKDITTITVTKKENPFSRIGIYEFRDHYLDIITYFYKKNKTKRDLYIELRSLRNMTFPSCFPVFSSIMRPATIKDEDYNFIPINKSFEVLVGQSLKINKIIEVKDRKKKKAGDERLIALGGFQKRINEVWDKIFDMINDKNGHIKGSVLGGRIDYTARNVIIPDPYLKADEVILCYNSVLELYKSEIMAYLIKLKDITLSEAYHIWQHAAISFDEEVYNIAQFFIKKHKPKIIINRPPTINFGSILIMKVVGIKRKLNGDYTMSLPLSILTGLNADFDGDNLSIISLKIQSIAKEYDKIFNPRKAMYISRNDGLFNNDFNLFKDQIIGLYEFSTI